MSHPWMPFYVADYLADTGHLSTLEHGAYLLLIMHYWQNGALPEDERKLARICRLPPEEWEAARETLAGLFGEGWRHKRIEAELAETRERYRRRAEAGRKGGLATASAHQRRSGPGPAAEAGLEAGPQQSRTSHNDSHREDSPVPPPEVRPPRPGGRGAFLAGDWRPSPANLDWAAAELGGAAVAARTLERFCNYWLAKPGKEGRKRDWDLTWRNWVNEEVDRAGRNAQRAGEWRGPLRPPPRRNGGGHDALIAAVAERVSGGGGGPPAEDPGAAGIDAGAARVRLVAPR